MSKSCQRVVALQVATLQENMLYYNINTTSAATIPVYTTKA